MSTPDAVNDVTGGATSSADLAVRTGPGRVSSANRAKIKREDAARDAALQAAADEEIGRKPAPRTDHG